MRNNPTRSGFLLLMLIAFASILLGLATTFYFYTNRGMDDSQMAVRIAQQRLALSAALTYVLGKSGPAIPIPVGTFYPSSGDNNAVQLSVSTAPRTERMGWYRVALADATYTPGTWPLHDNTNSVYITAGTGPSGGKLTPANPNDWQFELRSWYLVKLQIDGAGKYQIQDMTPVFPPPQTSSTVIYW